MRVLQIIVIEFLLGYILQAFSIVLGLYAFNKRRVDKKKLVITSLIMAVVIYVTRLLPVAFGVHTVLNAVVIFLFSIIYLKLPVVKSLVSLIFIFVILISIEILVSLFLASIIGVDQFIKRESDSLGHYIIGLPSSILFCIVTFWVYRVVRHKEKKGYIDADTTNNTI
jgi:hypothetical protein